MMYRVLIVDDEPIIRNGIRGFIDWEKEGMTVEHGCANGEEALAVLESQPVDILITDIKMPLLNGIELMRQAMAIYPSLKVILISNHSDFEYVKEGLKLGAVDYILKLTLERDELLPILRRCASMLEEERRRNAELIQYQEGALYRERKRIEQGIKRLIAQEQTPPSSADWAPAWLERPYVCAYLMLDGAEGWIENYGYLYVQMLLEDMQERFYMEVKEGAALPVSESRLFLLYPFDGREAEQQLLQVKQLLEKDLGISTSIGFVIEQGFSSILKGFKLSVSACQQRFFGAGGLYRMNGLEDSHAHMFTDRDAEGNWTTFYEIIRNGDPVLTAVEFAYGRWKGGALTPEQVKQEACSLLSGTYELHAGGRTMLPEQLDLLQRAETLEQLESILISQLEEIVKPFIQMLADNDAGKVITRALDYIAEHYTENLTLQSVADTVHLSKSYFSLLFKKQTGRNFIDYLIEMRIREAKRLLAERNSRIYDVAGAAGFNDVKYFSKMFKKVTGYTPMEYREKLQAAGAQFD